MQKPLTGEYNPYFSRYIDLIPLGDFPALLQDNTTKAIEFFENIPVDKHNYRYAEGKWSIKEVLMHMMDTERVMSYRALVAARGDSSSLLTSMDENRYAANTDISGRTMDDLLEEFKAIRTATAKLLLNLAEAQTIHTANVVTGLATTRALAYIIIGHTIHHLNVIAERY